MSKSPSVSERASSPTSAWVERYGRITKLVRRSGKRGPFVTFEVDCRTFNQAGVAFDARAVDALLKAGVGGQVWLKGPIEMREVSIDGATHQEETLKVVYFGIRGQKSGAAQAAAPTAVAAPTQSTALALVTPASGALVLADSADIDAAFA